jgi:hypothetical protein
MNPNLWLTPAEHMHDACHGFWNNKRHRHVADFVRPVLSEERLQDDALRDAESSCVTRRRRND